MYSCISHFIPHFCPVIPVQTHLVLQQVPAAIWHPQCMVGSWRSCWGGRCEPSCPASPMPTCLQTKDHIYSANYTIDVLYGNCLLIPNHTTQTTDQLCRQSAGSAGPVDWLAGCAARPLLGMECWPMSRAGRTGRGEMLPVWPGWWGPRGHCLL